MIRQSEKTRTTNETDITIKLNLDGEGRSNIKTTVKFLDHLLDILSRHSLIDLTVKADGDLQHHIVEDIALVLGETIRIALGDKPLFKRFGSSTIPMDCSLANVVIDISNRPYSILNLKLDRIMVEDMFSENINHFFDSLATSLRANIHVNVAYGKNDHHKAEAAFKSLAISLRDAISIDTRIKRVPSSKGVL